MSEKNTITRHDSFRIEQDGTFQINLGQVTLIFEITEDRPGGSRFVHLKSPEHVHFRVEMPTHVSSPTVHIKLVAATEEDKEEEHKKKLQDIISRAAKAVDWVRPHPQATVVVRQLGGLRELDRELLKVAGIKVATEQFGTAPRFMFVLDDEVHADEMADAKAKIEVSGLDAHLMVSKASSRE